MGLEVRHYHSSAFLALIHWPFLAHTCAHSYSGIRASLAAHPRPRDPSPAPDPRPVPSGQPIYSAPDVSVGGTGTAPIDALLFWRAEVDAAIIASCDATASHSVVISAKAAAEASTKAAEAAYLAASDRKSNAASRISRANKRCDVARSNYVVLLAEVDANTPLPTHPVDSTSPASGGNEMAPQSASDVEDETADFDEEEFEGIWTETDDVEGLEADAMELG